MQMNAHFDLTILRSMLRLSFALAFCVPVVAAPSARSSQIDEKVNTTPPIIRLAQNSASPEATSASDRNVLKRKIAIGRFTNETRYGKTLLRDDDLDPLGKQAADMLSSRLVSSEKFLVFERPDIKSIQREQVILGESNLIGVNTLLLGSITEFGRVNEGQQKFLRKRKIQVVHCAVDIRLVDPKTGFVFFSARGQAEATTENASTLGFGSKSSYDATLNDKVIGAAISDVINELVAKLEERPWRTDILDVSGDQVYISGGPAQGIRAGEVLTAIRAGKKVKSQQSGFTIELPGTEAAKIRILSHFGDSPEVEGSIAQVVSGQLPSSGIENYYLTE